MLGRSMSDKEHELHTLRQQLEHKRMEVAEANKKASDLMMQIKMIENDA